MILQSNHSPFVFFLKKRAEGEPETPAEKHVSEDSAVVVFHG